MLLSLCFVKIQIIPTATSLELRTCIASVRGESSSDHRGVLPGPYRTVLSTTEMLSTKWSGLQESQFTTNPTGQWPTDVASLGNQPQLALARARVQRLEILPASTPLDTANTDFWQITVTISPTVCLTCSTIISVAIGHDEVSLPVQ